MKNKFVLGLSLFTLLTLGGALTSCGNNNNNPTPTSETDDATLAIEAAMNTLTVPSEVEDNFELKVNAAGGVKITWTSSNESVIKVDGNAAIVTRSTEQDVEVTLTAVGKLGEKESEPKTFTIKVLKKSLSLPEGVVTVKEAKEAAQGESVTVTGVVSSIVGGVNNSTGSYSANGFYITDETETVYVYGYIVANKVERGDLICISATVGSYNNVVQLTSPTLYQDSVLAKNQPIADPSSYAETGFTIDGIKDSTANPNMAGKTYIFDCYVTTYGTDTYTNYQISTALPSTASNSMNVYSSATNLKCPECAWLDTYVNSKEKVKLAFYINSASSKNVYRGNIIYIF